MERQDDPTLSGDMILWRRIPPTPDNVTFDEPSGELRPSSTNFRDQHDELSVLIAAETTTERALAGHPAFGLIEFTAEEVRRLVPAALLCRDPEPDPAHVLICAKVTRAQSKNWARMCANRWVVRPVLP